MNFKEQALRYLLEENEEFAVMLERYTESYPQLQKEEMISEIEKILSQTLDQQVDEIEEMIFQDAEIPAEVCKHIREKLNKRREDE